MSEIYWLTRLDYISTLAIVFIALSFVITLFSIAVYAVNYSENPTKSEVKSLSLSKKVAYISISTMIFFTLVRVFTPTTKEFLIIYGVGGTLDYLHNNETAKEIPDKAIKCIDKLFEDYLNESENNSN